MTLVAIVVLLRLTAPLLILRWPFWGVLVVITADTFDATFFRIFNVDIFDHYQRLDKVFDTYALFFEIYAVQKLSEIRARKLLTGLFSWRVLGVVVFEITGIRQFLFYAPNIFEYFFVIVFGFKKFNPELNLNNKKNLAILLSVAAIPKVIFEYFHHGREYPLGIGSVWEIIKLWVRF